MAPSVTELAGYPHGRVPREVREAQILALGEQLFVERGYDGMTMEELAARAGVTKPVIYSIVPSKAELFRRCFERAAEELADAVAAAALAHLGDLDGLVRAGQLAFFAFIQSHASAFVMLFDEDAGGRHAAHIDHIRARQARVVADVLVRQSAAAGGRPLDPRRVELAVHAVNGAAEALAHWWRAHPDVPAEDLAESLTALTLPGLRALIEGD